MIKHTNSVLCLTLLFIFLSFIVDLKRSTKEIAKLFSKKPEEHKGVCYLRKPRLAE